MKLDIKVNYDAAYDCVDNIIASVGNFFGIGYEMMFAEAWDFGYMPGEIGSLGTRLILDITDRKVQLLEKYHGFKLNFHQITGESNVIDLIEEELKQNRPIAVYIDTFWLPWDISDYQKIHYPHGLLITGLDLSQRRLSCIDGQLAINGQYLSLSDCLAGCDKWMTFSVVHGEAPVLQMRQFIEETVNRVKESKMIDKILGLSEEVARGVDFTQEVRGNENYPGNADLFQGFFNVSRGRKQFEKTLRYLAKKNDYSERKLLADEIKRAGDIWSSIFGMSLKAYYIENRALLINRVAEKIKEVAIYEEKILEGMAKIVDGSDIEINSGNSEPNPTCNNKINGITYVEIQEHFNNQGFGSSLTQRCSAELSNGRRYFLTEGLPGGEKWSIGDMVFKLRPISGDTKDNVSCTGQVINITGGNYCEIMILGCGEMGSHSDYMLVHYEDGWSEKAPLELTNWILSNPNFGESIAWAGKGCEQTVSELIIYPFPVHLFAQKSNLAHRGVIKNIELPYCPNLHVFAISLGEN